MSCCRRLLYLDFKVLKNGRLGFNYHGRDVGIKISHLGINSNKILKFSKDDRIKEIRSLFNPQTYKGSRYVHTDSEIIEKLKKEKLC